MSQQDVDEQVERADVHDGEDGGGISAPVELTFAELGTLLNGATAVPGQRYTITDFQTVHTIPDTADTNTADPEPLTVTATDASTLHPIATSALFPADVIYYEVTADESRMPGSTTGFISRRIDPVNAIDTPFDFRNVKFRRYKIAAPAYSSGTTYAAGDVVDLDGYLYACILADTVGINPEQPSGNNWMPLELFNNQYLAPAAPVWSIITGLAGVKLAVPADDADYQDGVLLGSFCSNVSIAAPTNGSRIKINGRIGDNTALITIGPDAERILIGQNLRTIAIGFGCADIVNFSANVEIGGSVTGLYLGAGDGVQIAGGVSNFLTGRNSSAIVVGTGSTDCSVNSDCSAVTFGPNCGRVQFRNSAANINVGQNCYGLIIQTAGDGSGPFNFTVDAGVQSDGVPVTAGATLLDGSLSLRISKVVGQAAPVLVSIDGSGEAAVLVLTALDG